MHTDAVGWTDGGAVRLLDQTRLPQDTVYLEIDTVDAMVEAIQALRVRGAPLIGVSAAMGLAAAAHRAETEGVMGTNRDDPIAWLNATADTLAAARPTAVNLRWAVERVRRTVTDRYQQSTNDAPGGRISTLLREEAQRLWDEDADMCRRMGQAGADIFPAGARVLTHCNTGMLATGGIGSALGVIRTAFDQGKVQEVYACEARPLRQGSRLTAWELTRLDIPCTVIVDSAVATVMSQGMVDLVILGADRIAANGDVANKIGTQNLAVLANAFDIPFYVAAPRSTIDLDVKTGAEIPIENRREDEVDTAPGARVYNPAFDVTPAHLITGIVTDGGIVKAPYSASVSRLFQPAAA